MRKSALLISHILNNSGAPRSLLNMAKVLSYKDYKLEIWSIRPGDIIEEFQSLNIPIQIIDEFEFQNNISKLKDEIHKYDVAICCTVLTYSFVMEIRKHIPVIWLIHEGNTLSTFIKQNKDILMALNEISLVYTVSLYAKKCLSDILEIKSRIIYNYIEDEGYAPYEDNYECRRFLIIGHVCHHKGHNLVLEANQLLLNKGYTKHRIYFVGALIGGEETAYCNEFLSLVKQQSNVSFCGMQNNRVVRDYIKACTAVVIPSLDETCSLVALEAAMLGRPIILSNKIGASYLVDESSGWFFKNSNVQSLAKAIEKVINESNILNYSNSIRKKYEQTTRYSVFEKNVLDMVNNAIVGKENLSGKSENWDNYIKNKRENFIKKIDSLLYHADYKYQLIMYGVTARGERIYNVLKEQIRFNIVAWVDKNTSKTYKNYVITSPKCINEVKYDFILVTVKEERTYNCICKELIGIGVSKNKIIWANFEGII